jgi:hypothetical protein
MISYPSFSPKPETRLNLNTHQHPHDQALDSQSKALVLSSIGLGALGSDCDWTGAELDPHRIAAGRAFFLPATERVAELIKADLKVAMVQCIAISSRSCIG